MLFRTVQEYYAHVKGEVARSGYSNDWNSISFNPFSRTTGIVKATPLQFKDGSILRFYEEIILDDIGAVFRPNYSYHYERLGPHYVNKDVDTAKFFINSKRFCPVPQSGKEPHL